MDDKLFIEAVTERDIDLLLLEELTASPIFRQWLIDRLFQDDRPASRVVGVWHSISRDPLGESDLIYIDEDEEGRRVILIENKIDARPMPEQAERYRARGQAGVDDGDWHEFRTCVVAPRKYLQGTANTARYDAQISYEQIRNLLLAIDEESARLQHKAAMINAAIDKNRRGYQAVPDEKVTTFWHAYYDYTCEQYPQLIMREPGQKPSESDWPDFINPELGKINSLFHKLSLGKVDLYFSGYGRLQEEIAELNQDLFDEDVLAAGTDKTAFVQIKVPEIDRFRPFAEQQDKVDVALQAVVRLLKLFPKIQLPEQVDESVG